MSLLILALYKNQVQSCTVFSTSDRLLSDALLLSKVRFSGEIGRPWEAMGGRAPLIGSDRSHSQSGEHGLPRPPNFSFGRPNLASHGLGLPHFVMWSVWANQRSTASHSLPLSASQSASHVHRSDSTGWSNAFSREISQMAQRIGLSHLVCVRGRSAPRPPTSASHHKVMWSVCVEAVGGHGRPIGLSDRSHEMPKWEAVGVRLASHAHQPWESNPLPGEAMHLAVKSVRWPRGSDSLSRCVWEADRPPTASHFGLSLWPLTSDSHGLPHSLTDWTLWQIWLSDRSDRSDRSDWS